MGIPHWGHFQETLLEWRTILHLSYPKHRPTSVNVHIPHGRVLFFEIHWGWPCNCHTSGFRPRLLHVQTRYKISISQCSCPSLGLGTPGYEMGEALFLQYGPPIRSDLRSAPFVFDEFSSALEWIIRNKLNISKVIHILDDFSMPNFTPFDRSKYPHSSWENLPCMYPLLDSKINGSPSPGR